MNKGKILIVISVFLSTMLLISCEKQDLVTLERMAGAVELSDAFNSEFSLSEVGKERVSNEDLKGKYSIIYLGFTHCEGICNNALSVMSFSLDDMGKAANKINPIFIGVDANGDNEETVKSFVEFDKRIRGFYGSKNEIDFIVKNLRAYVKVVETEENDWGYTLDHSSLFYILDKDAKPIYVVNDDTDPTDLANLLKFLVNN